MAGHGPAPKEPDQMANKSRAKQDKNRIRVVQSSAVPPPPLPPHPPGGDWESVDGDPSDKIYVRRSWPQETLDWWDSWCEDPLTDEYRASDWLDLLDCAVIHARLWSGDDKAASELRLRMAKHGATREDRARLRITFASADSAEQKAFRGHANPAGGDARSRRGGLRGA